MKNVPEMISTKDSAYIKDMFNWNFIAFKKLDFYLNYIEDKEISQLTNKIANMHFENCSTLIKLLMESEDK